MARHKLYNTNQRPETDGSADDTSVLEADLQPGMPTCLRNSAKPRVNGLRRVHASLYTLQAYKRWMHQIRENWKSDKR